MIKNVLNNLFAYKKENTYNFIISNSSNNIDESEFNVIDNTSVSNHLNKNLDYLNTKLNILINSDIKIRNFNIILKTKKYPAFILYIDGLVDSNNINNFILEPLFLRNSIKMSESAIFHQTENGKKCIRYNLENFLYSSLIPQNNISKETNFKDVIPKLNAGYTILFVESLKCCFCIESKGFKERAISKPITESVVRGAHEGFVENIRTNTSLIRKIINNEKLIIEELEVGKITKTKVAITYLKNITNDDLISEVKYRIKNLNIDYILSTGQLEQFLKSSPTSIFPETLSTERPDKTCNYLLLGRVAILINGSPFSIIVPAIISDFLTSPEDFNLNYHYANFLRFLRSLAAICALLIPGLYIAITMYHYELIPTELLYAIIASREAIPFPIFFEIIIMELSFELLQEASIRVPSSFSTTVGIIGALILGEAAVSANIVSPILIIVIAFAGTAAFALPDNSLRFAIRLCRFIYILLGYLAGFLGIALGIFIQILFLSKQSSFGINILTPYIPFKNIRDNQGIYLDPVWKREKRSKMLNSKKPSIQNHISMKWRNNG